MLIVHLLSPQEAVLVFGCDSSCSKSVNSLKGGDLFRALFLHVQSELLSSSRAESSPSAHEFDLSRLAGSGGQSHQLLDWHGEIRYLAISRDRLASSMATG